MNKKLKQFLDKIPRILLDSDNDPIFPLDHCLEWGASKNQSGYGNFQRQGAHRVSYRLFVGDIPQGAHVLHDCDNPACINPIHLYLGSNKDNVQDRVSRRRSRGAEGSANSKAKLNEVIVAGIRGILNLKKKGKLSRSQYTQRQLAEVLDVDKTQIEKISMGSAWKNVEPLEMDVEDIEGVVQSWSWGTGE